MATLHLQETTSRQLKEIQRRENLESLEGVQKQNRRLHVELPFHSKFLLIAAYLASYNPAKSDKRFFVKHHGKQRKTKAGIAAKERAVSSQLTGPKASGIYDEVADLLYGKQILTHGAQIQRWRLRSNENSCRKREG